MNEKIKLVNELFTRWDTTKSPGCALAIIQEGKIKYTNGYGMATLEHPVTIKPSTVFYIASTSKQFAAFSIALLEEEGLLSAIDDVRKYIPELPDYGYPMRIAHLIHHTSGIRDYLELNALSGRHYDELITPEDALQLITRQKQLNFKPGDRYLYSNSGYFLLSVIVERVTGKTLRQFSDEKIFKPLGMVNTHFHDDRSEPVLNRAIGYALDHRTGDYHISVPGLETVGSGGIYSTVEDLALWDRNFYHNRLGKGKLELIERIQQPGVFNSGELQDYAFGLGIREYKGVKTVGHSGGYGGYSAEFIRFPDHSFTVICLSNNSTLPAPTMALKVAEIFLGEYFQQEEEKSEEKIEIVDLDSEYVKKLEGYYYNPDGEMVFKFVAEDRQLALDLREMVFPLTPSSQTRFVLLNAPLQATINFQVDGEKIMAIVDIINSKEILSLQKMKSGTLTAEEIDALSGEYHSSELNSTVKIYQKDGALRLKLGRHTADLVPGAPNTFITEGDVLSRAILMVQRKAGTVSSITLNSGRVRNILFIKK